MNWIKKLFSKGESIDIDDETGLPWVKVDGIDMIDYVNENGVLLTKIRIPANKLMDILG